jgi:hypothetical protein
LCWDKSMKMAVAQAVVEAGVVLVGALLVGAEGFPYLHVAKQDGTTESHDFWYLVLVCTWYDLGDGVSVII